MNTSIDMNVAKKIIGKYLDSNIKEINLDHIALLWHELEVVPKFQTYESVPMNKVQCKLHYTTHRFYNDIRVTSGKWDSYLFASLDAILQLIHHIDNEDYKMK